MATATAGLSAGDRPCGLDRQAVGRRRPLGVWEGQYRKMRVFRLPDFVGGRLRVPASSPSCWRSSRVGYSREPGLRDLPPLAGVMLVTSFALLYQERIAAVAQRLRRRSRSRLALAVAWAAWSDDRPHLFITSADRAPPRSRASSFPWRCTANRNGGAPRHSSRMSRRWWAWAQP